MHPIIVELLAQDRTTNLEREAESERRFALAKAQATPATKIRERAVRTAGRLRLILGTAGA